MANFKAALPGAAVLRSLLTIGIHADSIYDVMIFNWDENKNKKLQIERGVSFEEVVLAIEDGRLLDHGRDRAHRGGS